MCAVRKRERAREREQGFNINQSLYSFGFFSQFWDNMRVGREMVKGGGRIKIRKEGRRMKEQQIALS